ncbi:hypothetical protein [Nesterenkonia muleiensis]|uniref:hypothetical protein n=1 Tax=Nesterenkonia muleiensis TaxID=2282648 RepID=UPI000E74C055|nr:hypothetical protein [Nesterenkonia muleiensis]
MNHHEHQPQENERRPPIPADPPEHQNGSGYTAPSDPEDYLLDWQPDSEAEPQHQLEVRGRDLSEEEGPYLDELIANYGEAFSAYCSLPDVDVDDHSIEHRFREHYITSYDSREEVLQNLGGIAGLQQAIDRAVQDNPALGRAVLVKVDRRRIWQRLTETWDILPGVRQWHVFEK